MTLSADRLRRMHGPGQSRGLPGFIWINPYGAASGRDSSQITAQVHHIPAGGPPSLLVGPDPGAP